MLYRTSSHNIKMNSKILTILVGLTVLQSCYAGQLHIVAASQWLAKAPTENPTPVPLPIPKVIILHTATPECLTTVACVSSVESIQNFHMSANHFSDIGYNYLIGGDGLVYEGRGWGIQGAHTKGHNKDSVGIAFIGNFDSKAPNNQQLEAAQLLIQEGVKLNVISPNYKLYGQRQFKSTNSPGNVLFGIIQKWPHWSAQ